MNPKKKKKEEPRREHKKAHKSMVVENGNRVNIIEIHMFIFNNNINEIHIHEKNVGQHIYNLCEFQYYSMLFAVSHCKIPSMQTRFH